MSNGTITISTLLDKTGVKKCLAGLGKTINTIVVLLYQDLNYKLNEDCIFSVIA